MMGNIYYEIEMVAAEEIGEVFHTVLSRYQALFPDWKIGTYTFERKENRNEQIDDMIRVLEKLKASP